MNISQVLVHRTVNSICVFALSGFIALTAGCNFTGYAPGQTAPHRGSNGEVDGNGANTAGEARTYPDAQAGDGSDSDITADEHGAVGSAAAGYGDSQVSGLPCPEPQAASLIVSGQALQAQQHLDEILNVSTDEQRRSCTLSTMAYIAATPGTELHNPQQALDYQALARVNGAVRDGGMQLQLLDNTVSGMLAASQVTAVQPEQTYQRSKEDEAEMQRLREELRKKDDALEQLKRLTLGE